MERSIKRKILAILLLAFAVVLSLNAAFLFANAQEMTVLRNEVDGTYSEDGAVIRMTANYDYLSQVEDLDKIRPYLSVNGYAILDEKEVELEYSSSNKQLSLRIRADWVGEVRQEKENVLVMSRAISALGVSIHDNLVYKSIPDTQFWNKSYVSSLWFENQYDPLSGSYEKTIKDYGWAYGFSVCFSQPLIASAGQDTYLEDLSEVYASFLSVNSVGLETVGTEMFYNAKTYTLDVFVDKDAGVIDPDKENRIVVEQGFPLIGGGLGTPCTVYYFPQSLYANVAETPVTSFYDDFDSETLSYWVNHNENFRIEDGYLKTAGDFYGIRCEKGSNFDYTVRFVLQDETSRARIVFKTNTFINMNTGFYVEVGMGDISLYRAGYAALDSAPAQVQIGQEQEVRIVVSGDEMQVQLNGTNVLSAVNNTSASGYFGLGSAGEVWFASMEALSHERPVQEVADSIRSIPEIAPDEWLLHYPVVPEGYLIRIASSSDESVIAKNGVITLQNERAQTIGITFLVTSTYDDSKALTQELQVAVPVSETDESKVLPIENKTEIINAVNSVIVGTGNVSSAAALLRNEINKLSRWQVPAEQRTKFDAYFNMIGSLLQKAVDIAEGRVYNDKLGTLPGISDAVNLVKEAQRYLLSYLRTGNFLDVDFMGECGHVIDFSVFYKDGVYHMYYITGYAGYTWQEKGENLFGHATSTDLKNWTLQGEVLRDSTDGVDSFKVWAPTVTEIGGKYYMFYTAVNENIAQSVQIAVSDDLCVWNKVEGVQIVPGQTWAKWDANSWSNGRDPGVLVDGDTVYVYMACETNEGAYCIGVASSRVSDLCNWKDEGYFMIEAGTYESPYVMKKDGTYHIFYTNYGVEGDPTSYIKHAVSPEPTGGFVNVGEDGKVLMHKSASEVIHNPDTDEWYIAYISHFGYSIHGVDVQAMQWEEDGSVSLSPMSVAMSEQISQSAPVLSEEQPSANARKEGARVFEFAFDCDAIPDTISNVTRYVQHFVSVGGVRLSEIDQTEESYVVADWIPSEGKTILRLTFSEEFCKDHFSAFLCRVEVSDGLLLPDGSAAAGSAQNCFGWAFWTVLAVAVVAIAGGSVAAVLLIRRRRKAEKTQ